MCKRYKTKNLTELKGRSIFFDANILLYLFFSTSSAKRWQNVYSKIFRGLLNQNLDSLFVNSTVISETINRAFKEEYKLYTETLGEEDSLSYKEYRNSKAGKAKLFAIYEILSEIILPRFTVEDRLYSKKEINDLLFVDELDFNDKLIYELCKDKGHILLTNDVDYKNCMIDILSENNSLC